MSDAKPTFRRSPNVASRTVDGQAVVIVLGGETLHSLNPTGTWLWDSCCGSEFTVDELAARLAERYTIGLDAARMDVRAFVESLSSVGALEEVSP